MKRTLFIFIALVFVSFGIVVAIRSNSNEVNTELTLASPTPQKYELEDQTQEKGKVIINQMSEEKARLIAKNSECIINGSLKEISLYNEYTKTWWIDLDIDKPGCNPACVIFEDESVEVNWRCTGLITQ